jgi:hypothetical protein
MQRLAALAAGIAVAVLVLATAATARAMPTKPCGGFDEGPCGVHAAQDAGDFHGLIAVSDAPWVLNLAGHGGTTPGCGDCSWSLVLACASAAPGDPGSPACVPASISATCEPHQLLYRLYLTTDAVTDALEGTLCLGGVIEPIPISERAAGDVRRYLQDVVPPNLDITTSPSAATLAGLPTYFVARVPSTLAPAPFGGDQITETITIAPIRSDWRWGDGTASGWTADAATLTHSYAHGGNAIVRLTTRWGANYTITFQGEVFGPYQAVGTLRKQQNLTLPVDTANPTLVSH